MTFPSMPPWDGIHPAMVQFPIVLLLVAPLLLLISLFMRQSWRSWAGAALVLMALGSLAAWLAVASGHSAGQIVDKTAELGAAIARHEAFGSLTRNLFTILTLVFGALLLVSSLPKKPLPGAARISLHAVFLLVYLGCALTIVNTAYRGGRLVHEFGVKAMVAASGPSATLTEDESPPSAAQRQQQPRSTPPAAPGDRRLP